MHDRLRRFLEIEGLSPARFAEILGIQRSGVSHLLSGRNKPSFEFIEKLLGAYPDLNPEWLILGKGRPYKSDRQGHETTLDSDLFTKIDDGSTAQIEQQEAENETIDGENRPSEVSENPIIGRDSGLPCNKFAKKIARIIVFYNDGTYEEK